MAKYTITIEDKEDGFLRVESNITQEEIDKPYAEKTSALLVAQDIIGFAHRMVMMDGLLRSSELSMNEETGE